MTRVLGSMRRIDAAHGAVRMEDVYDTDVEDLWAAVTKPERLARWMGTVRGDLREGGTGHATFTSSWDGPVRIDVCEAPHHVLVTLEPGTPDETVVEARLTSEGSRTRLVVEERGLPLDDLPTYGAGWQAHLEDLGRYLGSGGPPQWKQRWSELAGTYAAVTVG